MARNERMSNTRWLAILALTTAFASNKALAGSEKALYWLTRSMTFLDGAGVNAPMKRP